MKYYLDASIWIDLYEDRKGYQGEPLGEFALKLFSLIKAKNSILVLTDFLIRELESNYSIEEINGMVKPFEKIVKKIAQEKNLPLGDVLHAIISRDHKLILITRDKHFKELKDIAKHYKPEELI